MDKGIITNPLNSISGVLSGAGLMAIILYFFHYYAGSTIYLLIGFVFVAGWGWTKYAKQWWLRFQISFRQVPTGNKISAIAGFLVITAYSALLLAL